MQTEPLQPAGDRRVNLLAVVAIFLRRLRQVALGLLGGLVLFIMFLILKPTMYTADAVLVPSTEEGGTSLLAGQLPTGLLGLAGGAHQDRQKLIISILHSRTLADSIYSQLYPSSTDSAARDFFIRQLPKRRKIDITAEGAYVISVRDREAEQAARIANAHAALTNRITAEIGRQALTVKSEFLERQLIEAREQLVASENALLQYQEQTDAPDIQEQSRQTVEAAAELQRMIFQKELEVIQLRRVATPNNPELQAAVAELNTMREQIRRLTGGAGAAGQVFVPLGASPELKVGSLRLLREFKKDEQIYLSLTASLSETQLDVQNNLPAVALLDPAPVPTEPSGISRPVAFFLLMWLGFLGGLALALAAEYFDGLRRDPASQSFHDAWSTLRARRRRPA